jgi:hypothetical protein
MQGLPDYEIIENLTEQPVKYFSTSTPPIQEVGDAAVYYDDIFDASGETIGHTVGYAVALDRSSSDGHLIVIYDETVRLPGGTIRATGTFDRNAILEGKSARLHAVGTGGSYQGKVGIREWWLAAPLPNEKVKVRMVLVG